MVRVKLGQITLSGKLRGLTPKQALKLANTLHLRVAELLDLRVWFVKRASKETANRSMMPSTIEVETCLPGREKASGVYVYSHRALQSQDWEGPFPVNLSDTGPDRYFAHPYGTWSIQQEGPYKDWVAELTPTAGTGKWKVFHVESVSTARFALQGPGETYTPGEPHGLFGSIDSVFREFEQRYTAEVRPA